MIERASNLQQALHPINNSVDDVQLSNKERASATSDTGEANDLNSEVPKIIDLLNSAFASQDFNGASFLFELSDDDSKHNIKLKTLKEKDGEVNVEKVDNYSLSDDFSCEFDIRMLIINMFLKIAEQTATSNIGQLTDAVNLRNTAINNFFTAVTKFLNGLESMLNLHKAANSDAAASSRLSAIGKISSGVVSFAAGAARVGSVLKNGIDDFNKLQGDKTYLISTAAESAAGHLASGGADVQSSRMKNDADDKKDTINILMQQFENMKAQAEKVSDSMQQGSSEAEKMKQELVQKAQELMNSIFRIIFNK